MKRFEFGDDDEPTPSAEDMDVLGVVSAAAAGQTATARAATYSQRCGGPKSRRREANFAIATDAARGPAKFELTEHRAPMWLPRFAFLLLLALASARRSERNPPGRARGKRGGRGLFSRGRRALEALYAL